MFLKNNLCTDNSFLSAYEFPKFQESKYEMQEKIGVK